MLTLIHIVGRVAVNNNNQHSEAEEAQKKDSDEGDCVFLGAQPIKKKPPLALITISDSDSDSDNENDKNNIYRKIKDGRNNNSSILILDTESDEASTILLSSSSTSIKTSPDDDEDDYLWMFEPKQRRKGRKMNIKSTGQSKSLKSKSKETKSSSKEVSSSKFKSKDGSGFHSKSKLLASKKTRSTTTISTLRGKRKFIHVEPSTDEESETQDLTSVINTVRDFHIQSGQELKRQQQQQQLERKRQKEQENFPTFFSSYSYSSSTTQNAPRTATIFTIFADFPFLMCGAVLDLILNNSLAMLVLAIFLCYIK